MSRLLTVPVSAVDADWIDAELYPQLEQAILRLAGGGVLWLGVDSCREGNYLLEHVRVFAQKRGIPCGSLLVSMSDPYLFWDDIVGACDQPATVWGVAPGTLMCLENGFVVPARLLRERHRILAEYARGRQFVLIAPVTNLLRRDLEGDPVIGAPPFRDVPEALRRELAVALLADAFPGEEEDRRHRRARDLLAGQPVSRVELEAWIDYFAALDTDGTQAWRVPPPIARHSAGPADIPTRDELQARLRASVVKLREASLAFNAWRGQPLIHEIRQPPDPFEARDPVHWFSGTVSFLFCYLFDAVDDGFVPLLGWRWNDVSREIESAEPLQFLETLRSLRTVMQHGLVEEHPRNRTIVAGAERWCRDASGSPTLQRAHCRAMTSQLLRELEATANRLNDLVVHAAQSSNRDLIESQLDLAMRRLPKYRWRELLEEASARLNVDLDLDRVLDRHLANLQAKIQESPEKGGALVERARQIACDLVVSELAWCPVTGEDLIAGGIPRGPLLGQAKAFVEESWRKDATQAKDALVALARDRFVGMVAPTRSALVRDLVAEEGGAGGVRSIQRRTTKRNRVWFRWMLVLLGIAVVSALVLRLLI